MQYRAPQELLTMTMDYYSQADLFLEAKNRFPYYIVSPTYTQMSAGIRVLNILCSALNQLGQRAYMLIHPALRLERAVSPHLSIPVLTARQIEMDFDVGLTPIVIYPEVVGANIFNAPLAFEYLLNFRGALVQERQGSRMEGVAYSEVIRNATPGVTRTIFIPTSDPKIFYPSSKPIERSGVYYYAAKYRLLRGKAPEPPEEGAIEILRDGAGAPSRDELLSIYKNAARIYVYENTAVATEAAMCGCPVVCMPSDFFLDNITRFELGTDGIAWGNDPDEVERAVATVSRFFPSYLTSYQRSHAQLSAFIAETQDLARTVPYAKMIDVPVLRYRARCDSVADFGARIYYRLARFGSRWVKKIDQ